jgi:hypothetical protein
MTVVGLSSYLRRKPSRRSPVSAESNQPLPGPTTDEAGQQAEWGEMTMHRVTSPPVDLAPMLKGLPDDRCQCPHWGYLFRGRIVVRYADHDETIESGQAFYMAPGHVPEALDEIELLQFSPTDAYRVVDEVMQRNMATMAARR